MIYSEQSEMFNLRLNAVLHIKQLDAYMPYNTTFVIY